MIRIIEISLDRLYLDSLAAIFMQFQKHSLLELKNHYKNLDPYILEVCPQKSG